MDGEKMQASVEGGLSEWNIAGQLVHNEVVTKPSLSVTHSPTYNPTHTLTHSTAYIYYTPGQNSLTSFFFPPSMSTNICIPYPRKF